MVGWSFVFLSLSPSIGRPVEVGEPDPNPSDEKVAKVLATYLEHLHEVFGESPSQPATHTRGIHMTGIRELVCPSMCVLQTCSRTSIFRPRWPRRGW